MELQLVSKEVAILAKELGFNETCHNLLTKDGVTRKISIVGTFNTDEAMSYMLCTLPEQELLAKWLRDVHKIRVQVGTSTIGSYKPTIYQWNFDNLIGKWERIGIITSMEIYEDAMEVGLSKALEILKGRLILNSK